MAQHRKQLNSLQPLRSTEYIFSARPIYVWISIIVAWMASLLPWRTAFTPDILLVVLAFWAAHNGRGVGLVAAFVFGFLLDVQDTTLLGTSSLTYVLTIYCVLKMRGRMMNFNVTAQMIYMLPVFLLAQIPEIMLLSWHAGQWIGWFWISAAVLNCLLWLAVHLVLKLPWQSRNDNKAVV
ncbi:rod shape-determining protein MreD [Brackiella oedipodis]|uniref:rod shape-determining protein MreD n=1 Tax=Brackiella oedipodis TaxID=124225 RepID=UPI00048E03FD|nr:rod shape-determining protein MreD [Brackiella oedipodis]